MTGTQRTRPLTKKQRHVLSVLADGGVIVHHSGVRGRLISTRLFHSVTEAHAGLFGEDVHPVVFRSLKDSGATFSGRQDPELIECFKPRGVDFHMASVFRISAKGRTALKLTETQPTRLTCHECGNMSGGTAWWWDTRLWTDSANGSVCPVCLRDEMAKHAAKE